MQSPRTSSDTQAVDWDFLVPGNTTEEGGGHMRYSHHSNVSTTSGSSAINIPSSGHSRFPSSSSSLVSSPPRHDSPEQTAFISHKKTLSSLPDVEEEPLDRDGYVEPCPPHEPFDASKPKSGDHHRSRLSGLFSPTAENARHSYYFDDEDDDWDHHPKRRRSGESARNSFTTRILTRLPSISKRAKERKRASLDGYNYSGDDSPQTPSRSSSRATSFRGRSKEYDRDQIDMSPAPVTIETIVEDDGHGVDELPDALDDEDISYLNAEGANIERTTTPILPLLMTEEPNSKQSMISPLQSPTVAPESASYTPIGTPQISAGVTPTVSNRPSVASFKRGHQSLPPPPLPNGDPITSSDTGDDWDDVLGHANFRIVPEPYLPDVFNLNSSKQFLADWETARSEFSKHLARTNTHYGTASKTYRLTLAKWETIDAQWRQASDLLMARIAENGELPPGHTPLEPAPIVTLPSMDDPQSEGKFPKMGDNDIVGRMEVVEAPKAPQVSRKPSRRSQFLSMFQFPRGIRGRSASQRV